LAKVRLVAESDTVVVPVPVSATICGLPVALSLSVSVALLVPVAVGVNVTLMAQIAPAATLDPQVLVWAKSPLLAPVIVMLLMVSAAVPVLVRVSVSAALFVPTVWLPKAIELLERLTAGVVPVPVSATVCGLFDALSVMVTVPETDPVAVGVKVTGMRQLPPAASG
jgi:hypothetical protein